MNNALSLISPLTGALDFNGNVLQNLAAGSVGSPAIYKTGDTNTGIYFSAADTLDIATGGGQAASFGASFTLRAIPEDSRTTTVDVAGIIESTTSGTPAAGIGVGLQFNAESQDENPCPFGRLDFAATDIATGTEDTYFDILLRVAGVALETKYRFVSTAATGFQATITHGVTADRTYTLPDADGTFMMTNGTLAGATVSGAAPATPAANVIYSDSLVKGWVQTSAAGAWTIDDDLNVSSITDNGTGDLTINWATAFASANYGVTGMQRSADPRWIGETDATAKSATVIRLINQNASGVAADPAIGVMIIAIGDQ